MKSLLKISELADKFDNKLKKIGQDMDVSQEGTTELFFINSNNQSKFAADAQNAVQNVLLNYWNKFQKPSSFVLTASAVPKVGAKFNLTVNPPVLKNAVLATLDKVFKGVVGNSMMDQQKIADKKAKSGSGSGTLNIATVELGD